jgi:plasmid stabilization system protein ParE
VKELRILSEAADDLQKAYEFYEQQDEGAGNYFLEMAFFELHRLSETSGMHPVYFGYHRKLITKFPFAIYYRTDDKNVEVSAVLDLRSRPSFIYDELKQRG